MAPLEMPKNFWFYSIFLVCNLIQELTISASFSQFASLAFINLGSKCVVSNPNLTFGIELKMAKKYEHRKKRKLYERSRKFQNTWMIKVSWAKFMFDEKCEVQQVWCKVYTFIEGKHKLAAPKLDSLLKHQGRQKAKVLMLGVNVRSFCFNKKIAHAQNEYLYITNDHPFILD